MPEKCEAVFRKCTATSKKYGFGINPSLLKTWFSKSVQAVPEKCEAVFLNNIAIIRRSGFQKLLIVRFFSQVRSGIFGRVLTPIDCQFYELHYVSGIKISAALQSVEDKNPMKMPINRV